MTEYKNGNGVRWILNLLPLGGAIVAIALSWGDTSARLNHIDASIIELKPVVERAIRLDTQLEEHRERGAHPDANRRITKLETEISVLKARIDELIRRLDKLIDVQKQRT